MSLEIEKDVLEKACRKMIETILLCLPNAFKGTIYLIGKPPALIAERITSGIVDDEIKGIFWGLPTISGYNTSGKCWSEYRDEPGRPLEAMAWCVERQKSWTSEDPASDTRSVRLQVKGIVEDFHHMEPVLVRKSDLNFNMYTASDYPRNHEGNIIWKDSEYVVVAVIKIHFLPHTIKIDTYETRVIKKLSRSLGTELLSYQLHQNSMKAMQQLAQDRLNACNILADSLRNAITKSALIFSLVKQEIGSLRDQWEQVLLRDRKEKDMKMEAINNLNDISVAIVNGHKDEKFREELIDVQNKFCSYSMPPEKGENWIFMQIEERWKELLSKYPQDEERAKNIRQSIDKLKRSLHLGHDPDIVSRFKKIPEDIKKEWVNLLYGTDDQFNSSVLEGLIKILSNKELEIPTREKSRKTLIQLKALAETINQLEQNTNFLLNQVLNGKNNMIPPHSPNRVNCISR